MEFEDLAVQHYACREGQGAGTRGRGPRVGARGAGHRGAALPRRGVDGRYVVLELQAALESEDLVVQHHAGREGPEEQGIEVPHFPVGADLV